MISRYTRPAMGAIWELENKFNIWKEIELLACEAQAEPGAVRHHQGRRKVDSRPCELYRRSRFRD